MFRLDADYSRARRPGEPVLSRLLDAETRRRDINFKIVDTSVTEALVHRADAFWTGIDGLHAAEIKAAAEFIGNMDHAEEQLEGLVVQEHVCHVHLLIYGGIEDSLGGSAAIMGKEEKLLRSDGANEYLSRVYSRRLFREPYLGVVSKLERFHQRGVLVTEAPNLEALSVKMVGLYNVAQSEGSTFNRLIKTKQDIAERDPVKRAFMLTLMGIQGAGIGEEVADAIANGMDDLGLELNPCRLIRELERERDGDRSIFFQFLSLRSGKRTIGPAAVKKLKEALGV